MAKCRLSIVLLAVCSALALSAQQPPSTPSVPRWTVLVDPVCPVSSFYGDPAPNATKKLRVLYFPESKAAKLKNPESLTLQVGFNYPQSGDDKAEVPFARKGDHWEALVQLEEHHAMYAIFDVKDDKSGAVDNNEGKYWDVVFCFASGERDMNAMMRRAQSYAGVSWPFNIHRAKDYGKAVSILESAMAGMDFRRSSFILADLWTYKAERDGGDAAAYAKLAKELDQFMADHASEKSAIWSVGNFTVTHLDQLPAEFVGRTLATVDATANDPRYSFRAGAELTRAIGEPDLQKRLAALDAVISKYSNGVQVESAQQSRFMTFVALGDVAGAESAFAKWREAAAKETHPDPNAHLGFETLARMYIDKGIKLEEALKLIDDGREAFKFGPGDRMPSGIAKIAEATQSQLRARAYLGLHKPDLALIEAQKAIEDRKDGEDYFVLAQSYAATGSKQKALDAYFEAALSPSNKDLDYRAELEKFYVAQHFGKRSQFAAAFEQRRVERFGVEKYVPKLVDQPAPVFSVVTLKGEKLDASMLTGKTIVVNFWSPG
jgi:tetratricopeptide (TPR) repeat protein